MTTSKGRLDAVYPALLAVMNNIAAYATNLSAATCSKIIQLFASMSSPSFLLAKESNHQLISSLLEFINTVTEHQFTSKLSPTSYQELVLELTSLRKRLLGICYTQIKTTI